MFLFSTQPKKETYMKTTSFYPVIMIEDVAMIAAFYVENFGFKRVLSQIGTCTLRRSKTQA